MLRVTQSDLPAVVWVSISPENVTRNEFNRRDDHQTEGNSIESLLSYFLLLCVLLLSLLSRSRVPTMGFHSPIHRLLLRRSISAQRKKRSWRSFLFFGRLGTREILSRHADGKCECRDGKLLSRRTYFERQISSWPINRQPIKIHGREIIKNGKVSPPWHNEALFPTFVERHYSRRGLEIAQHWRHKHLVPLMSAKRNY